MFHFVKLQYFFNFVKQEESWPLPSFDTLALLSEINQFSLPETLVTSGSCSMLFFLGIRLVSKVD